MYKCAMILCNRDTVELIPVYFALFWRRNPQALTVEHSLDLFLCKCHYSKGSVVVSYVSYFSSEVTDTASEIHDKLATQLEARNNTIGQYTADPKSLEIICKSLLSKAVFSKFQGSLRFTAW